MQEGTGLPRGLGVMEKDRAPEEQRANQGQKTDRQTAPQPHSSRNPVAFAHLAETPSPPQDGPQGPFSQGLPSSSSGSVCPRLCVPSCWRGLGLSWGVTLVLGEPLG